MALSEETIRNRFTYHKPVGNQPVKYEIIRNHALDFALILTELCPDCRETSLALTKLEEAVMWANAGIARNPEVVKGEKDDK